jgi:hypothetical protein
MLAALVLRRQHEAAAALATFDVLFLLGLIVSVIAPTPTFAFLHGRSSMPPSLAAKGIWEWPHKEQIVAAPVDSAATSVWHRSLTAQS